MIDVRYRPIDSWPGKLLRDDERTPTPFDAAWRDTMKVLDREVRQLGAFEVVLQLAVPESAIRMDGGLRADRRPPEHPGVIVSVDSPTHGPLRYSCDEFVARTYSSTRDSWRHNVRAVALGLEALRRVDRYGIAKGGEQYAGWKQLGAGTPLGPPAAMTVDEAARILLVGADVGVTPSMVADLVAGTDPPFAATLYRLAARRHHPDAGGSPDTFRKITEARDLLAAGS